MLVYVNIKSVFLVAYYLINLTVHKRLNSSGSLDLLANPTRTVWDGQFFQDMQGCPWNFFYCHHSNLCNGWPFSPQNTRR